MAKNHEFIFIISKQAGWRKYLWHCKKIPETISCKIDHRLKFRQNVINLSREPQMNGEEIVLSASKLHGA